MTVPRRAAISSVAVSLLLALLAGSFLRAPGFAGARVAAAGLASPGYAAVGFGIRRFFSAMCHQRAERSFWLFGAPMVVCARCLGVYAGAAAGSFLRLRAGIALGLLGSALVLNCVDVAAEMSGLHGNLPWLRLALGVLLGVGTVAVLSSIAAPHVRTLRVGQ